jgi:hypothetical protein
LNLISAIFYCAATGFTKCSVLVFYLRIFPSRNFHIAVWTIVFIAVGYSLASVFVNIFSCSPIPKSWDASITTGACINRPVFYFANAGLGIFTDFATVVVPMYVLVWTTIRTTLTLMCIQTMAAPITDAHATENRCQFYSGNGLLVSWVCLEEDDQC